MTEREIISYLKTLAHDSWRLSVTSEWSLKDVVAHMIGWTELDIESLERIHEIETLPWRKKGFDVNKYNAQSVGRYLKIKPDELLNTWNRLLDKRNEQIESVGKNNIKEDKELFFYLFEGGNAKHTLHHYQKIIEAVASLTIPKS